MLKRFGQASWSKSFGSHQSLSLSRKTRRCLVFPSRSCTGRFIRFERRFPDKGSNRCVLYGEDNPMLLLIPKGVAHGYRVLGRRRCRLCILQQNRTTQNPDEKRELRGMMRRSDLTGKRHLNREERPFAGERSFC